MPPRNKRKQTAESNFLFVNEDASTVTRGSKDAEKARRKQSHVQKRNFEQRLRLKSLDDGIPSSIAQEKHDRYEETGTASSHPLPLQQRPVRSRVLDGDLSHPRLSHGSQGQPLLDPNPAGSIGSGVNDHIETDSRPLTANEARIALNNPLRSFTLHPLLTDRFELLQKWAPPLMRYWTTVLLPEKFYTDSRCVPIHQMRHAEHLHNDLQLTMSNPAHMYSFLATVSTQMLAKESRLLIPSSVNASSTSSSRHENNQVPFIFQNHAFIAIRRELAGGVLTHAIVNDVHCLLAAAYHSNQFDAALPHYRAMLRMITALGGLSTFSPYFVESMFLLHWSACLKRLARPSLPVSSFDPGQGTSEIRSIVARLGQNSAITVVNRNRSRSRSSRRGAGTGPPPTTLLQNLETACLLNPALVLHAQSLSDVLQFSRWAERQSPYNPTYFKWAATRHVAVGYHLLSTEPDVLYGKLNEAVRIALIFSVALTRSPESGQRCASKSGARLKALLESSTDGGDLLRNFWGQLPHGTETLLWVSVVGGLTSGKRNTLERRWFRDVARGCAVVLGLSGGFDSGNARAQYSLNDFAAVDLETGDLDLNLNLNLNLGDDTQFAPELFIDSTRNDCGDDHDDDHGYHQQEQHKLNTSAETETETETEVEDEGISTTAAIAAIAAPPGSKPETNLPRQEWELVQDILSGFVWDEELQGEPLRVFWAETHG